MRTLALIFIYHTVINILLPSEINYSNDWFQWLPYGTHGTIGPNENYKLWENHQPAGRFFVIPELTYLDSMDRWREHRFLPRLPIWLLYGTLLLVRMKITIFERIISAAREIFCHNGANLPTSTHRWREHRFLPCLRYISLLFKILFQMV